MIEHLFFIESVCSFLGAVLYLKFTFAQGSSFDFLYQLHFSKVLTIGVVLQYYHFSIFFPLDLLNFLLVMVITQFFVSRVACYWVQSIRAGLGYARLMERVGLVDAILDRRWSHLSLTHARTLLPRYSHRAVAGHFQSLSLIHI